MQQRPQTDRNDDASASDVAELWGSLRQLMRREYPILLALLAGLVLAEMGLRLVRPDLAGLIYARGWTGGHPVVVTAQGFRVPPEVPADRLAQEQVAPYVIGIGDSVTYGTGVAAEETWPLALDQALTTPIRLRNGGIPGASLRDLHARYQTLWRDLEGPPKVFVLMVTGNLVSFTDYHWERAPLEPEAQPFVPRRGRLGMRITWMVQSSALWKAATAHISALKYGIGLLGHRVDPEKPLSPLLAYGWVQPDLPVGAQDAMWQRFEAALGALNADMAAAGDCLVIGFAPPRFKVGSGRLDNLKFVPAHRLRTDPKARVARLAAALDRPFVDAGAALGAARAAQSALRNPLYIPDDYTHLDAAGHAVVSDAVGAVLYSILKEEKSCVFNN